MSELGNEKVILKGRNKMAQKTISIILNHQGNATYNYIKIPSYYSEWLSTRCGMPTNADEGLGATAGNTDCGAAI